MLSVLSGRRLRKPAVVVVAGLAVAAVALYAVRGDASAAAYRTAVATTGDVEQVLSTGGVVNAARRADLAFATGGTVASVEVAQGDRVRAGQVVAVLDRTSLRAAVVKARAAVASARAQLESDRDAQTATVATATQQAPQAQTKSSGKPSTGDSDKPASSGNGKPASGSADTPVLATLKSQQTAVLTAQTAAGKAIAAAKAALAAQARACAGVTETPASDDGEEPEQDAGQGQADVRADALTGALADCDTALSAVRDRQDDVATAQDALAKALSTLTGTLTKALGTVTSAAAQGSGQGEQSGSGTGSGMNGAGANGSGTGATGTSTGAADAGGTRTVTAATLAADQASIDQAEADLVTARQALRHSTLTATRSGTVASISTTKGESVSAGDTVAIVVGGKAVTVTGTVSAAQVRQVAVGQTARVTTPGSGTAAAGRVSAVGLVGDTSSGSAAYPVTVLVEDPAISLPTGSRAMLDIVVGAATDMVTVPVSAVSRDGDSATVQVERDGTPVRRQVTLGAVGATSVAVTDGIEAGDTVVLADLDRSITDASTAVNTRGGFAGPGGGAFPGGMPPGMQGGGR